MGKQPIFQHMIRFDQLPVGIGCPESDPELLPPIFIQSLLVSDETEPDVLQECRRFPLRSEKADIPMASPSFYMADRNNLASA